MREVSEVRDRGSTPVLVHISHRVISDAMVLSLSGQAVGWSLPAAESLGLVIVDFHWPIQWHWQHIKHGSVATRSGCVKYNCFVQVVVWLIKLVRCCT